MVGLAFVVQPVAGASAAGAEQTARLSVSKTAGLVDGTRVTVRVTGFRPNSTVFVGECGGVRGEPACPAGRPLAVTTDSTGSAAVAVPVRRAFEGYSMTGAPLGVVDCATSTCYLLVSDPVCEPSVELPMAVLSFQTA
ncbi:enediyne antibiotic chromoprotein [Actinokineospora sp. NPDC004072]